MKVWFGGREGGVEEHGCISFEGPERLSARGARLGMKKFAGIGICPPLLVGITLDFTADRSKHCCHFPYQETGDCPRVFSISPYQETGDRPRVFSRGQSPSFFDDGSTGDSPRVFCQWSSQPMALGGRVPKLLLRGKSVSSIGMDHRRSFTQGRQRPTRQLRDRFV